MSGCCGNAVHFPISAFQNDHVIMNRLSRIHFICVFRQLGSVIHNFHHAEGNRIFKPALLFFVWRDLIFSTFRITQYTSELYRGAIQRYCIVQSMSSDDGRCHDNARCESMWNCMKEELFYVRRNPEEMTVD